MNEIRLMASIKHPNVIEYKESFIDDHKLCLVMEYCDGGDLSQVIARHSKKGTQMDTNEILSITAQMISGLKALHDAKVCHRDFKAANVFLT